jgi:DNA-binding phage protein
MPSLREALEGAFEEDTQTEVVDTPSVEPVEAPEPSSGPARDASGKFAPKSEEVQPIETPQPEEAPPPRRAPSSWKPAAQEAFLKADRGEPLTSEEIKLLTAEAERRESDFHKGVSEFKSHSERAKAYDNAIAPFQQHLQRLGVDAPTAIQALMRADVTLRTADPATKAQYFQQLAREYGIDLGQVQNMPAPDPQAQYLMQQMHELRQQQQMWQNQIAQQEQMRAQQELQSFSSNGKPHFDAVRNDMADLLETGKATSLEQAYEMAVWMRADTRQTLLEQQRAEAQKVAQAHNHAQRARTAAVSVKGSSPASTGVQPGTKGSLRDILSSQFEN